MSAFKQFNDLHHTKQLFILPNAWDAKSATLFEQNGYPAVATSSMAVANSLGFEDGEGMTFDDYLFVVKRILASVKIPVTVDMEMGYGKTNEAIASNVWRLAELGVAGINIEDSTIDNGGRTLKDPTQFAETIKHIKTTLGNQKLDIFINVRCDTFILNVENKLEETKKRLKIYETTGANGIFLPLINTENDIAEALRFTKLPLNVMCMPGLPDFDTLNKLGVKRASMGPFMFKKVYGEIGHLTKEINAAKNFSPILS